MVSYYHCMPVSSQEIVSGAMSVTSHSSEMSGLDIMAREPLPKPAYEIMSHGIVMTDEQMAVLKHQITVYRTCTQELFKIYYSAITTPSTSNFVGHAYSYEQHPTHPLVKPRQRWSPQPAQLQLLEKYFSELAGTPHKAKLKDITLELAQHGQITDTNVYNWFQNRKARAKRKQSSGTNGNDKEGENDKEDEAGDGEEDEAVEKKARLESEDREEDGEDHVQEGGEVDDNGNVEVLQPKLEPGLPESTSPQDPGTTMQVIIDGKSWDVPLGLLDVKTSFGEGSILVDSQGVALPTNEAGVTLKPLEKSANYTLRIESPVVDSSSLLS